MMIFYAHTHTVFSMQCFFLHINMSHVCIIMTIVTIITIITTIIAIIMIIVPIVIIIRTNEDVLISHPTCSCMVMHHHVFCYPEQNMYLNLYHRDI